MKRQVQFGNQIAVVQSVPQVVGDLAGQSAARVESWYHLDEPSRFGKAPLYTAEMWAEYVRAEAVKLTADASRRPTRDVPPAGPWPPRWENWDRT
jgi:hypothetical protein